MTVKFKKLKENAVMPTRSKEGDGGFNLTVADVSTAANARGQIIVVYHTGIGINVPSGYEAVVRPASNISAKTLRMCGSPRVLSGNIDDEITVEFVTTTDVIPAVYNKDEVFAQLVINKVEDVHFVEVENKQSAGEDNQSLPENEDASTNSDKSNEPSGGAENSPEEE